MAAESKTAFDGDAVLFYDSERPPLGALAVGFLCFGDKRLATRVAPRRNKPSSLQLMASGQEITGRARVIATVLAARSDRLAGTALLGDRGTATAAAVEHFCGVAEAVEADAEGKTLPAVLKALNAHLQHRTHLADGPPRLSLADLAVWGALTGSEAFDAADAATRKKFPCVVRWLASVSADPRLARAVDAHRKSPLGKVRQAAAAAAAAERVAKLAGGQQQQGKKKKKTKGEAKGGGEAGSFEIPLPGAAEGQVCTRFPPEPSGYLHIGHAKAALLNDYFAKRWKGRMILRFDDTNPAKEKDEYVQNIISDLATLGVEHSILTHTSDYFEEFLQYATRLIKEGRAYVDDTPVDQMRDERMNRINSKRRDRSVEENLKWWDEMQRATPEGKKCVVRAKMEMQADNACLRDPVMYRCNDTPHHRTGTKYKLYPTYDFACPIIDSLEGVSHTLRTTEYHDRNAQFNWFCDALGLRKPAIWDYGRLSFKYSLMSKRKLQWFVDQGLVEGWFDPRFPTVQGMIRRGLQVEALRAFVQLQGASKLNTAMEWDKIWNMNKKLIDPVAHRYIAIGADSPAPVRLVVEGGGAAAEERDLEVQLHPKNAELGHKKKRMTSTIYIEQEDAKLIEDGEEVTLRVVGNAVCGSLAKGADGAVESLVGELRPNGNPKKTKKKLTWIEGPLDKAVPVLLVEFGHLITKAKIEAEEDFKDYVNPNSRQETRLVGEPALAAVEKGQVIQLERRGYCRCDEAYGGSPDKPLVLFFIPDGKEKAMSTLSSKVERVTR